MEPGGAALVTGAGRGIGRAVALELAARGFDVVAGVRDPPSVADLPDAIAVARLDVRDPGGFEPPVGLRVVVNNAGVEAPYLPVEATPLDVWRDVFETNVFGLVELTRRCIPAMRDAGGGVVVNITTVSLLAPMPFFAAYRASKAAVSAMGESLRAEVAGSGIRVVEVLPGPIDTDMYAGSRREPEAAGVPGYDVLAASVWAAREAADIGSTPAPDAARAIVDAALDDDGPLRHACDPLGAGLLEGWRADDDESFARAMLQGMGVNPAQ